MNPPDIGIDGYNIALPQGTGVASYGIALADTLRRAGYPLSGIFGIDAGADASMREVLFFDRLWQTKPTKTAHNQHRKRLALWTAYWPRLAVHADNVPMTDRVERRPLAGRFPEFTRLASKARLFELAHHHFGLYRRFLPLRMDNAPAIMHWTYPVPITLVGARNIYTVHDIVPLRLPYMTQDPKAAYRTLAATCISKGAHVCTVSESSRTDILREFSAHPHRVTNCYQTTLARSPSLKGYADDAAAIEGTFALTPKSYFLFFGAIEPKKNVGRLIEAFLSQDSQTPLVIVGGRGWQSEQELRLLPDDAERRTQRGQRVSDRIIHLDHLPRSMLDKLIRNAKAVVFPSVTEGFGLPVLEAMTMGTPVLTSDCGALREVAGDAAIFVDPYDVRSIAAGLRALDEGDDLRARLSKAGLLQAPTFSQERYAERLGAMYAAALETSPAGEP